MNRWLTAAVSIIVCQMAGIVGSLFTVPVIGTWYESLQKPFFTPPNYVFGPVWITLYTLMGISLYLVLGRGIKKHEVRNVLYVFAAQLSLNALWSAVFFGLQSPLYGFMVIVLLWATIALTIIKFYGIDRRAGLILIPYIAWVTIASFLNYFILILN